MSSDILLYLAAALLVLVSVAHSWLGEKYILTRLFRRDNLPKLFGGTEFTIRTLRFAWHLTSVAWCGFAAVLVSLVHANDPVQAVGVVSGVVFIIHFLVALIGSKGKHLSWIVFLLIGVFSLVAVTGN
ncbi:hypothetical protein NF212_19515 [Parasalinivibrio latis]|uniref:hypothetical protein n=1 Tax=Parasalinivibrio latis TaxID=2952610 RepID=UPI0030E3C999